MCLLVKCDSINFSVCGTAANHPGNLLLRGPSVKNKKQTKPAKTPLEQCFEPEHVFIVKERRTLKKKLQGGAFEGNSFFALRRVRAEYSGTRKTPLNFTPPLRGPTFLSGQKRTVRSYASPDHRGSEEGKRSRGKESLSF